MIQSKPQNIHLNYFNGLETCGEFPILCSAVPGKTDSSSACGLGESAPLW